MEPPAITSIPARCSGFTREFGPQIRRKADVDGVAKSWGFVSFVDSESARRCIEGETFMGGGAPEREGEGKSFIIPANPAPLL